MVVSAKQQPSPVRKIIGDGQLRVCSFPLRSQTSSLSTPDANTMGVTSVLCQLELVCWNFSGALIHI